MTADKREKIINTFRDSNDAMILLLSLRATATGLNLTMANNVFIVDPWWNVMSYIFLLACYRGLSHWQSRSYWTKKPSESFQIYLQRHNRIANQCFTSKKENPIHKGVECRPKEGERLRRLKIFVIELNKKILFSKLLCKTMMSLISFSIKTRRLVLKSLSNHKK